MGGFSQTLKFGSLARYSFFICCSFIFSTASTSFIPSAKQSSPDTFGAPRPIPVAPPIGQHPRVLFDGTEFEELLERYAQGESGSWEAYFRSLTAGSFGPTNEALQILHDKDIDGIDPDELAEFAEQYGWGIRANGAPARMEEGTASALYMMSFQAFLQTKMDPDGTESPLFARLRVVMDKWARIINAHADKYQCIDSAIPASKPCVDRGGVDQKNYNKYLWQRDWNLDHEWRTGVFGLAMAYDMMYNHLGATAGGLEVRDRVAGTISRIVAGRYSWGMGIPRRRAWSNWVTYHGNLWLANLAIEGEGADEFIAQDYPLLAEAYMRNVIYPAGGALEDGYITNLAFREGSNVLVALAKRGQNHLETQKFRNFIEHTAVMYEPWACGGYIGHSSGGAQESYPAAIGLMRWAYPDGTLPAMLWKLRMGNNFKGDGVCRAEFQQTITQLILYGASHKPETPSEPSSVVPRSHYDPIRGLVVTRSSSSPNPSLYTHFDARGDAFLLGHDNADRGGFTLSSFGKTLIPERPWRHWTRSEHHALLHIDGKAQLLKAPSAKMMSVTADSNMVLASADLTKSYSTQWFPAWVQPDRIGSYYENGGWTEDNATPADYGWYSSDYDNEIGLPADLFGDRDFGFDGTFMYKKPHLDIAYMTRSTAHVMDSYSPAGAYFLVVDRAKMNDDNPHEYSFQIPLADGLEIDESRSRLPGVITLGDGQNRFLDVHIASSQAQTINHEVRVVTGGRNEEETAEILYLNGTSVRAEFWVVLHPYLGGSGASLQTMFSNGVLEVTAGSGEISNRFELSADGSLKRATESTDPPTTTTLEQTTSSTTTVSTTTSPSTTASTTTLPSTTASTTTSPSTTSPSSSTSPGTTSSTTTTLTTSGNFPQQAIDLPVGHSLTVRTRALNTDASTFLLPGIASGPAQVVVRIIPQHDGLKTNTRIDTCNRFTRGDTRITLVTCTNYATRACTAVPNGFNDNGCRTDKSRVRLQLEEGAEYFAIVEVRPYDGVNPRVRIKHQTLYPMF